MIKYLILFIITLMTFIGCSGSLDTATMGPDERLKYAVELYNDESYEDAVNEFQAILLQYPGNAVADDAEYYYAMTRYNREEYILAAFEFSKLVKNMPASEFVPIGQFMLAECYYNLSPNYTLDQRYTKKAIEEYQAFIDFFPTDPKVLEAEKKIVELNEKLAQKEFNNANIYEKMDYYTAAIIYYNNVIDIYHDTRYAPLAMYNKIQILVSRGRNSEAVAEISKYLEKYPENSRVSELQDLKRSLESNLSAAK